MNLHYLFLSIALDLSSIFLSMYVDFLRFIPRCFVKFERLYRFEHVFNINFGAYLGIAAISLSLISNSVSGNEKKKKEKKKEREKRKREWKRLKWDAKGALVKFVNDFFEPGHWQTWAWCRQRVSTRKKKKKNREDRRPSMRVCSYFFFFFGRSSFLFLFLFKIFFFFLSKLITRSLYTITLVYARRLYAEEH